MRAPATPGATEAKDGSLRDRNDASIRGDLLALARRLCREVSDGHVRISAFRDVVDVVPVRDLGVGLVAIRVDHLAHDEHEEENDKSERDPAPH